MEEVLDVYHRPYDPRFPIVCLIVLVTNNLNTHRPTCLYERFAPDEGQRIAAKHEWYYTPKQASWLNSAEGEPAVLARQCLARRIADSALLACQVAAWAG